MIGWLIVTGSLTGFATGSKAPASRHNALMLLTAWMVLSGGMLLLGIVPAIHD